MPKHDKPYEVRHAETGELLDRFETVGAAQDVAYQRNLEDGGAVWTVVLNGEPA